MKQLKPIEETVLWKGFAKLMEWILFLVSVIMIGLVFATVIVRYLMKSSLFGVEEVIMLMAMIIYWLGAAYGSYENSHINAEILAHFVRSKKAAGVLAVAKNLVTILIMGLFAYWSIFEYLLWTVDAGTATMQLHIPLYVSGAVLAVSLVLMTLYQVHHLVRVFRPYTPTETATKEGVNV